jgi:protein-S-isoprenylcysteine O-methyltransferase Ste14
MKTSVVLFLKNLLFTLVVPGTIAVYVPWRIVHDQPLGSVWFVVASTILFGAGAAIYFRCVWDFAAFGRGTPAPIDEPRKLVIRGLYRHTRNPIYLGVLTAILGWALLYQDPNVIVYAACIGIIFHLFVVFYEEPHLRRKFGVEYDHYCSKVGRWLPKRPFQP